MEVLDKVTLPLETNNDASYLVASLGDTPSPPTYDVRKKKEERKVSWRVIEYDKVHIMVNRNGDITGKHVGLMIGESGQSSSLIYDPSGHYDPCRGKKNCQTAEVIGSGRTIHGKDTDFAHYVRFQIDDDGSDVHVYTFDIDVKDIQTIRERIEKEGGGGTAQCTTTISRVITGIEPFGEIYYRLPKNLKERMDQIKKEQQSKKK